MKVHSYGFFEEVLPYYGTLDEIYMLMRSYNNKCNHDLANKLRFLESRNKVQRKTLKYHQRLHKRYSKYRNDELLAVQLFKIKPIYLSTVEKYQEFNDFVFCVVCLFHLVSFCVGSREQCLGRIVITPCLWK